MSDFKLTAGQWNNIRDMLEDWKNNPKSNYSDKERFFQQWFEAFIEELIDEKVV